MIRLSPIPSCFYKQLFELIFQRKKKKYTFIGSINLKGVGHYNTILIDPFFEKSTQTIGCFEHDGIGEGLIKEISWDMAFETNQPYILYKMID